MRINKFIALNTKLSRRKADQAVKDGRVVVDGKIPALNYEVQQSDKVIFDGQAINKQSSHTTLIFHKPVGVVCSLQGQGNKTIYDLLPTNLKHLNTVGRLDKNSSGIILLSNDGKLTQQLSHPSFGKSKTYEVLLDTPLSKQHLELISETGVKLNDGISRFEIKRQKNHLVVSMVEGRNRQIRRTFEVLGYKVIGLHRISFGKYNLNNLKPGEFLKLSQ